MSLLISIEGIDGSGKSTLIEKLNKKIPNSLLTREPRGTELGKIVHELTDKQINNGKVITNTWTYWFLYAAAQSEHVSNIIKPSLEKGQTIISDRYIDSMFVYQGKLGIDKISGILEQSIKTPFPDITFVLDIEVEKAQKRLQKRTDKNTNWDNLSLEFHQKIRDGYLGLKKYFPNRIHIINADRNEEEIFEEVWEILQQSHLLRNQQEEEDLPKLVRVVIENEKAQLLMVKDKEWGWNFPGGKIEKGETPLEAAKREVFEETNLMIENCELMADENIFFANLEKGNQHWKGYFYHTNKYSGEIKNKEVGKILDIKFIDYHSPEAKEGRRAYQKFFRIYEKNDK